MKTILHPKTPLRHFILFGCLLSVALSVVLTVGCDDEKPVQQPARKIVSKKISLPGDEKVADAGRATTVKTPMKTEAVEESAAPSEQKSTAEKPSSAPPAASTLPEMMSNLALQKATAIPRGIGYDPKDKINPFLPLIRQEPVKAAAETSLKKETRKKRVPRTPLEKIELSQLRLRAIVRIESGNKALVEESTGKGYILEKGTYIGTNQGRVVAIEKDRVIIEEEVENVLGDYSLQRKEMILPKPTGE